MSFSKDGLHKLWYVHTVEYYWPIKNDNVDLYLLTLKDAHHI